MLLVRWENCGANFEPQSPRQVFEQGAAAGRALSISAQPQSGCWFSLRFTGCCLCLCFCSSFCHSRRESAFVFAVVVAVALAFVLAFLSVIPEGNLLFPPATGAVARHEPRRERPKPPPQGRPERAANNRAKHCIFRAQTADPTRHRRFFFVHFYPVRPQNHGRRLKADA
jgi:hypothetical protein